jgi:hypothetical protein
MVTSEASLPESASAEVLELESLSSSEEQPAMTRLAATTTAVRPVRGERSGLVERARERRSTEILRGFSVWGGHGQNVHGEDREALDKGMLPSLSGGDRS